MMVQQNRPSQACSRDIAPAGSPAHSWCPTQISPLALIRQFCQLAEARPGPKACPGLTRIQDEYSPHRLPYSGIECGRKPFQMAW